MNRHVIFRIVLLLVVLGAVIGIGLLAFNAGVRQGLAIGTQASGGDAIQAPLPVYLLPHGGPWVGLGGFGCFGALMVLFLLFVIFGAARGLLWRGRWSGHSIHHGPWNAASAGETGERVRCVPPIFDEWHRLAHAVPGDPPAEG